MNWFRHGVDVLHYTIGITKPKPNQYGLFLLLWVGGTVLITGGVLGFAYFLMISTRR